VGGTGSGCVAVGACPSCPANGDRHLFLRNTSQSPPDHKLRPAITALAIGNIGKRREAVTGGHAAGGHTAGEPATGGCCDANHANHKPRSHDTSRIAAGPEFQLLATNEVGDTCLATPAIADGMLSVRSAKFLIAVERKSE
jgi:hypothetical protein